MWSSSAPNIAVVSQGEVTGVSPGTAVITAELESLRAEAAVEVIDPNSLVSLAISPPRLMLSVGATAPLSATGTLADGTTQDVTQEAMWDSSAPMIAEVSNVEGSRGQVTGSVPGQALITAMLGDKSAMSDVSVGVVPVADAGPNQSVFVGQTVTLNEMNAQPETVRFAWRIVSQPDASEARLFNPNAVMPMFVADQPGDYLIELVVTDEMGGATAPDHVKVTAVVPAVYAKGVGLQTQTQGTITLDILEAP